MPRFIKSLCVIRYSLYKVHMMLDRHPFASRPRRINASQYQSRSLLVSCRFDFVLAFALNKITDIIIIDRSTSLLSQSSR